MRGVNRIDALLNMKDEELMEFFRTALGTHTDPELERRIEERRKKIQSDFEKEWSREHLKWLFKKSRQKKRRLTYRSFLEIYKQALKYGAEIWFKTDNTPLYEFSLEEFRLCGFELKNLTDDLHNTPFAAENIMTEYEKAWSEKGFPIHRCEAVCPLQDTPPIVERGEEDA